MNHLYIHVPFCARECPYCGFDKQRNLAPDIRAFLQGFQKEFLWAREHFNIQPQTIYFGGGTPSVFSLAHLKQLFTGWPWREVEEFTFECNPETLTAEKMDFLRSVGVNRISLGVQSMDEAFLKRLGRRHSPEQVRRQMPLLRERGFNNVNLDLIFGLPGQTLEHWRQTLDTTLALKPDHLSVYGLTVEPETPFETEVQSGRWRVEDDLQREMFLLADEVLEQNGFSHYEISNYARAGMESVHNLAYWEGKDYLGLGAGAVSTVGSRRWKNSPLPKVYAESPVDSREEESLSTETKQTERMFLGLRTRRGVPLAEVSLERAQPLVNEGLARVEAGRVSLTPQGMVVADEIAGIFDFE